jgi:hypothetical protein
MSYFRIEHILEVKIYMMNIYIVLLDDRYLTAMISD